MKRPELLAPAGNMEMLVSAINAGADAIYFGIAGLNMRARADNFSADDMKKVVETCHSAGVRAYVCVNTIVYEDELEKLDGILKSAIHSGVDAVICWDLAVLKKARELGIAVHLSTQASAANSEAVDEYRKLGARRFVLARECTLEQVKAIRKRVDVELEVFIHGAMCVAVSGRCFISEHIYGKSANRGECIQPCRRSYIVEDAETGKGLELSNHHVMSPKDLCTIMFIDRLMDAGIHAFKIEGRNRSPEYVKTAVSCYREAIGLHLEGRLDIKKKKELEKRLGDVYNRGFSAGFYMGKPVEGWTDAYGSKSAMVKEYIGVVRNHYAKAGACEILIETGSVNLGDTLLFIGPTTGCEKALVGSMEIDDKKVRTAAKGQSVGVGIGFGTRSGDRVYLWRKRKDSDSQG